MSYAKGTRVTTFKSRAEIEQLLQKAGARTVGVATEPGGAQVAFTLQERMIRFRVELPRPEEKQFTAMRYGRVRSGPAALKLWEQACRERWRALFLCIKAKLVSVDAGVETFEQAFLAHIVMPDGQTVGQRALPAVAEAYRTGEQPRLLLQG